MVIQVNQELCTGCGLCLEACTHGAIQLWDGRARIDQALCKQCEACIETCPDQAINAITMPAHRAPVAEQPSTAIQIIPARNLAATNQAAGSIQRLTPLARAALIFLGREVVPRLVDTLIAGLERRLTQPTVTSFARLPTTSPRRTSQGKCNRRQARHRRRTSDHGNLKGRR